MLLMTLAVTLLESSKFLKSFFECQEPSQDLCPMFLCCLSNHNCCEAATTLLNEGPGLVSKFVVPQNFECLPPSDALRRQFPLIDEHAQAFEEKQGPLEKTENVWANMPANLIPHGVAHFTTWNEPAEFVLLDALTDENKEAALKEAWQELLHPSTMEDDDRSAAVTASMSVDSSCDKQAGLSEQSSTITPSTEDDSAGEIGPTFFLMTKQMILPLCLAKAMSLKKEIVRPHCMHLSFLGIAW